MNLINRKFLTLLNLSKVSEHDMKLEFECPYSDCKSDGKTKAYVLSVDDDKAWFFCFRCNRSHHISTLLSDLDYNLYMKYREEKKFYDLDNFIPNHIPDSIEITTEKTYEHDFSYFRNTLESLDKLSSDNKGKHYIEKVRRIPKKHYENMFYFKGNVYKFFNDVFKTDLYAKQAKWGYIYEGVIVPFLTKQDHVKKIVGFGIRVIGHSKLRFINLFIEKIATGYFLGEERVDYDKPIIIVEGLLDKLSFNNDDNVLALMSLNLKLSTIKERSKKPVIYVLDNQFLHKDVIEQANQIIENGFYICTWGDISEDFKDINDLRKSGWNDKKIKTMIFKNCYKGLEAEMMLENKIKMFEEKLTYRR